MRPVGAGVHTDPPPAPVPGADVLGLAVTAPEAREMLRVQVGRLLTAWLEAFDGRRPVAALRTGPFSPDTVDQLQHQIRESYRSPSPHRDTRVTPSRLLRVHLPPAHRSRPAFVGSVLVGGKVRALAGFLGRHGDHWRIDDVTLL